MSTLEMNIAQVNSDLQAIKTAIVNSGVEVADGTSTSEYADKVGEVYEAGEQAGRQAEYDAFWDVYQKNGTRRNYYRAFADDVWGDATLTPKYPVICEGESAAATSVFYNASLLTRIPVAVIVNGIAMSTMFARCSLLKTITLLSLTGVTDFASAFSGCYKLEDLTIEGEIEQQNFDVQWSALLSRGSILSIINALSDTTSDLTVTFSLIAVNNAFETSEGAADGSTSAEWLALVETKSNWTISLA